MENRKSFMTSLLKATPLITPLIAIFGILIPVAGFSYIFGHLSVFGIDMDSMPREFIELWSTSFYVTLLAISDLIKNYHWILLLILGFITFLVLFALAAIFLAGKEQVKSLFISLDEKSKEETDAGYILRCLKIACEDIYKALIVISSLGIFLLFLWVLLATPFMMGRDYAKERLQNFNDKNCVQEGWSNCVIIRNINTDEIISKGLLIAITRSHIAIYDGSKSEILPRLDSYSIVKPYNEKKLTDVSEE